MVKRFRINTITIPQQTGIYNYAPSVPGVSDVTFINVDSAITSYVEQIPLFPNGGNFGWAANQDELFDGRLNVKLNGNTNLIIVEKIMLA
jgi:hypothetical protein